MLVRSLSSYVVLIVFLFSGQVMLENACTKLDEHHEIGKKLPISPFKVLHNISHSLCYRECEAYPICLSINFNRKVLMCELNSQKRNGNLSLVDDNNFIYRDADDYGDKKCGSHSCNKYSKCVHAAANRNFCIAIDEPKSCTDILRRYPDKKGKDGVYTIIAGVEKKSVFCDMSTDQGGWTVIQRRQNVSINFYRTWNEYRSGFGDPSSNHWIGNDAINALTTQKDQELRVDLESFEGDTAYALYSTFYVENVNRNYNLTVSGYSGTAGDSLAMHNGMDFSTYDNDNDRRDVENCAVSWNGAWWYNACHKSNLNGLYSTSAATGPQYVIWYSWKQGHVALKKAVMMIRTRI